jgi:Putative MetA-pathway of phenol degradation
MVSRGPQTGIAWVPTAVPAPSYGRGSTGLRAVLLLLALAALDAGASAQDLEPRAYVNTPVGLNFLLAGYGYAAGGVATDPALPLQNAHLQVHSTLLTYARALDVSGRSGKVDVVLPYAWLSGTAEVAGQPRECEVSGLADPRLRFSVTLYGALALSLPEFARYRQDLIIGTRLQASVPLGQYDADKLVNIGTHRWSFKPESLNFSYFVGRHIWRRRGVSPPRGRAHRLQRRGPLRGLRVPMAAIVALRHTTSH